MDIIVKLTSELGVRKSQVEAAVKLIDEGNTIPFIARYRKEATGSLNDEVLRNLHERLLYLRSLEEKKAQVIESIQEQGLLTDELRQKIENAETQVAVDDLYRPYRPKKKTRASVAKERGLEPLALYIRLQNAKEDVAIEASKYVDPDKDIPDVNAAIAGAMDIIAETISDDADYRAYIRKATFEEGFILTTAKDKELQSVYEMYYDFEESLKKVAGHRVLAINRGEEEKALAVKIKAPEERILTYLEKQIVLRDNKYTTPILVDTIKDAYSRLIAPAIERDIRNELTEKAEDGAISVFGKNLTQLLMAPPIAGKVVLGWDPAFRTGCKLAVVDATGKVLDTKVIYPTAPQNKVEESKAELKKLIKKYGVQLISVGNGTASRESEQVIVSLIKELDVPVQYVIVNEAGASVYSASKLATEEFPNFDVGQRSAASIARRLQDPLAELVKIDPKSIGVGQYQHDMNQKKLSDALGGVVEDCVNKVGVDLNTASASLLEYISGISKPIAKNIVVYREANGKFKNRAELLKVPKLGPKAYEQCAGFLRILDGNEPLDKTAVHPESYSVAKKLLEMYAAKTAGMSGKAGAAGVGSTLVKAGVPDTKKTGGTLSSFSSKGLDVKKLAAELSVGEITLTDIMKELEKPSRDPREDMPSPILKSDVMNMEDLKEGMILKGTVRNVIDFGAFVDIGVHQDGLVHVSQMSEKFIKHPLEAVSVGDIVDVQVLSVDLAKKRIALTMKIK